MTSTAPLNTAATALELLDRSRHSLLEACQSTSVAERYLQAHLAALRAAAALVAARAEPGGRGGSSGPRSLWELVPTVAPELSEWAGFFELASAQVPARRAVALSAREADDLLRQAEAFLGLVCRSLGMPVTPRHGDVLAPMNTTAATTASTTAASR
jgi:hypothetical protein